MPLRSRTAPVLRAWLGAALLSLLTVSAFASERPSYTPIRAEHVEDVRDDGEVRVSVRQSEVSRGTVVGLIRAPANELYEIVLDYASLPEWSGPIVAASERNDNGRTKVVHGETHLPWPLSNRTWGINVEYGQRTVDGHQSYVVSWTYIPGSGNINENFGYWLVLPWPEDPTYSYVKYVLNTDPNIAIPDWLIRTITRRVLPDLYRNLTRRHAELYRR